MKFLIYSGRPIRQGKETGELKEYEIEVTEGMVVLGALLAIQSKLAPGLSFRCNCKAGKCGSCSVEINGIPMLMCKTRLSDLPKNKPVIIRPLKTFTVIKDLVTDISWNFEVNRRIPGFNPGEKGVYPIDLRQEDVERAQEFRKCIECFLCQDTCHVLREHNKKDVYFGPRFFVRIAGLEMHPADIDERLSLLKDTAGMGYCNITKCCSEVCPEKIKITDNAIIPLKERLVGKYYDPLKILFRKLFK